jgi:hypothetical protein
MTLSLNRPSPDLNQNGKIWDSIRNTDEFDSDETDDGDLHQINHNGLALPPEKEHFMNVQRQEITIERVYHGSRSATSGIGERYRQWCARLRNGDSAVR